MSSQTHQLSAVLMSPCGFLFVVRVGKLLPLPVMYGYLPCKLTAKNPFLLRTSSRLLKEISPSLAFLCCRLLHKVFVLVKQEQRICKKPKKTPKTALSTLVLYQSKCLHRYNGRPQEIKELYLEARLKKHHSGLPKIKLNVWYYQV